MNKSMGRTDSSIDIRYRRSHWKGCENMIQLIDAHLSAHVEFMKRVESMYILIDKGYGRIKSFFRTKVMIYRYLGH